VSGLTAQQTEKELNKVLSKYIRDPQIVVSIAEVRSQPGLYPRRTKRAGCSPGAGTQDVAGDASTSRRDPAGRRVQRPYHPASGVGCLPLPKTELDASGSLHRGRTQLEKIMEAKNPRRTFRFFRMMSSPFRRPKWCT